MVFTSSIKVISFSKYLRFRLVLVLSHAKWANLILLLCLQRRFVHTWNRVSISDHSCINFKTMYERHIQPDYVDRHMAISNLIICGVNYMVLFMSDVDLLTLKFVFLFVLFHNCGENTVQESSQFSSSHLPDVYSIK